MRRWRPCVEVWTATKGENMREFLSNMWRNMFPISFFEIAFQTSIHTLLCLLVAPWSILHHQHLQVTNKVRWSWFSLKLIGRHDLKIHLSTPQMKGLLLPWSSLLRTCMKWLQTFQPFQHCQTKFDQICHVKEKNRQKWHHFFPTATSCKSLHLPFCY